MADTSNSVLFDEPGPRGRRTIRIANWIAAFVFVVLLALVLLRLHNPPQGENQLSWELWKPALEREAWTDFYLPGLWATIRATIVAVIGAVAFGLVFGVGRLLPNMVIRGISAVIVEFCRAVPVLLLMIFFWRWFAFAGLSSPSYWAVVLALVLYNGSVVAELVRSGVGNLPNGQREASLALGLTETQSLMQVEVPQAVYAMLPAAVTQLVVVLKDTALGSIIMYTDLLQESRRLGSMYFNILQTLVMAAVIYFVACWLLSRLAEWLPERMQQRTAAPAEPEPVAPIAIMDPSNVNQIAVAKEVKELPLGGTPRKYHVHHRGTNASIRNWRRTRYEQGYDETHPESQVDPATGEFPAARKAAEDDKAAKAKAARAKRKTEAEAAADADDRHADKTAHHTDAMPEHNPVFKHGNDVGKGRTDLGGKPKI
ncbi:ABC transporter permease [Bifidobacterium hapali]|uniref:ABC transporter permease n=1 Tax=Bifidobacterium hapali TaxID=1630172 RepID=A0A261G4I2_9BIFI|nr:amino acid ABC transporter permease [Bifidobacterium hapali]OZG66320.1 ABC transporter permease [Bifidobacterium hapali]